MRFYRGPGAAYPDGKFHNAAYPDGVIHGRAYPNGMFANPAYLDGRIAHSAYPDDLFTDGDIAEYRLLDEAGGALLSESGEAIREE